MKHLTIGAVALTLTLTACGSGGGTDNHLPSSNIPTIKPPVLVHSSPKGKDSISDKDLAEINRLTINGKTIELVPKDHKGGMYIAEGRIVGTNLVHSRYGFVEDRLFSKGVRTSDMPTIGSATYWGTGFHYENDVLDTNATNSFIVNFGNKNIMGSVRHKNGSLRLNANISGNTFRGIRTDISTGQTREIKTEGAFYGPNAVEMSGHYSDDQNKVLGAFGAKR